MRGRWLVGVLVGLVALSGCLVALSGCAITVAGQAEPVAGGAQAAVGACRPADLLGCMVAAPAGAQPYSTPLGPNGDVTTQRFLSAFYPDDAQYNNQIADQLRDEGLQAVAHRNWEITNGDQVDIVLLGFASASGARDRARLVAQSTQRDPTLTTFSGSGMPGGVTAFVDRTIDKYGNIGVRAYAAYGQVELEFNYFRPGSLDAADLTAQIAREVRLLQS